MEFSKPWMQVSHYSPLQTQPKPSKESCLSTQSFHRWHLWSHRENGQRRWRIGRRQQCRTWRSKLRRRHQVQMRLRRGPWESWLLLGCAILFFFLHFCLRHCLDVHKQLGFLWVSQIAEQMDIRQLKDGHAGKENHLSHSFSLVKIEIVSHGFWWVWTVRARGWSCT